MNKIKRKIFIGPGVCGRKARFSIILESIYLRNIQPIRLNDIASLMPKFTDWFNRQYKRWVRSQPGAEDFLAFCSLIGYPPATVIDWLEGETLPKGPAVMSIAGMFGVKVYQTLELPEPNPELMKIFNSFSHLPGDYRSRVANALWEVTEEIEREHINADSEEAKKIIARAFEKWGFNVSKG